LIINDLFFKFSNFQIPKLYLLPIKNPSFNRHLSVLVPFFHWISFGLRH
jgi:hypothetical protein